MGYVYSNPYADAANALSGGANTLGETVLKMAMLRQQGRQRQQDLMMQLAQMQQTGQYNQQRLGMEQQGLDLRKDEQTFSKDLSTKEFGLKEKASKRQDEETGSLVEEHKAMAASYKQRAEQAAQLQQAKNLVSQLLPRLLASQPAITSQGGPAIGPAAPQLDEAGFGALQGATMQTASNPLQGGQAIALLQALRGGALNDPNVAKAVATGSSLGRPAAPIFGAGAISALSKLIETLPPDDPMAVQARAKLAEMLGGGQNPQLQGTNTSNIKSIKLVR